MVAENNAWPQRPVTVPIYSRVYALRGRASAYAELGWPNLQPETYACFKSRPVQQRHPVLNTVPTAVEQGFPELIVPGWQGFVAPAEMPPAILARLEDAFRQAVADREIQANFAAQGQNAVFRGPQDMARMIQEERARWAPIIRNLGIQID